MQMPDCCNFSACSQSQHRSVLAALRNAHRKGIHKRNATKRQPSWFSALCTAPPRRGDGRFSGPTKCWNQHGLESRLWQLGLAFGAVHSEVFICRLALSPPRLGGRFQCQCTVACLRGRDSTFLQSSCHFCHFSLLKCLLPPPTNTSGATANRSRSCQSSRRKCLRHRVAAFAQDGATLPLLHER